jgi:Putative restriction endonuclease
MKKWYEELPNRRLELIDGKFTAGLSLDGSKRLLKCLLESWGGVAALSLTDSLEVWVEALNLAYEAKFRLSVDEIAEGSSDKIDSLSVAEPLMPPPTDDFHAYRLTQELEMAFFRWGGCHSSGRDFVCKLGQNAVTPCCSLALYESVRSNLTNEYHDGPPEIMVEFFHTDWDLSKHLKVYFEGKVPEIWLFNVDTGQVIILTPGFDEYQLQRELSHGQIASVAIPSLCLELAPNWNKELTGRFSNESGVFKLQSPPFERIPQKLPRGEVRWDSLEFKPLIELTPVRLTFDEFYAWTGEAKYESYGSGLVVGSPIGSRNVLGQLLMTFGLIDVCKIMPPKFWREAIGDRLLQLRNQSLIREKMMSDARRSAHFLRDQFGLKKIGLAGELAKNDILGSWSRISLILFEEAADHQIYQALRREIEDDSIQFFFDGDDYLPLEVEKTLDRMIFL